MRDVLHLLRDRRFHAGNEVFQQGDVAQVESNDVVNNSGPLIRETVSIRSHLLQLARVFLGIGETTFAFDVKPFD